MKHKTASVLLINQRARYTFNIIIFLHIKSTNDLDKENTSIFQNLSKHLAFSPLVKGKYLRVWSVTGISSSD